MGWPPDGSNTRIGRPGRRRLADHVEGIARRHDGVGERQQGQIGVLPGAVPEEAAMPARRAGSGPRRAAGVRREAVIIRPAPVGGEPSTSAGEAGDVGFVKR